MAPVQTFSSSPITAAKAPAPTAQSPVANKTAPGRTSATATAASPPATSSYAPPSAQQGSRPSNPSATPSASSPPRASGYAVPTPTQPLPSNDGSPPAPRPGAVPTPPAAHAASHAAGAAARTLPPPPRKGETLGPEHTGAAAASAYPPPTTMPAQMSYPPPEASRSIRGTSVAAGNAAGTFASPYEVGPVQLPVGTGLGGGINRATDMSHPPGYQQDAHAAEFSSGQRAAHDAYVAQHTEFGGGLGGGDGESSIWSTAKKWAAAAGDTLAAAEGEVWKAVNKDQK